MIRAILAPLLALTFALTVATPCSALDADRRLAQLQHTAWTGTDGAPTEIIAIQQTPDGFLWLATTGGLYRFDGVTFERVDLFPKGGGLGHAQDIYCLTVAQDGSLWIGFRIGGILHWTGQASASTWYGPEAGLPAVTVFGVQPDKDGRIWATTPDGLFRLQGDRWLAVGAAEGVDSTFVRNILESSDGTLWVGGGTGAWYSRPRGSARFERSTDLQDAHDVNFGSQGRRWLLDAEDRLRTGSAASSPMTWPIGFGGGILPDRDGGVWVYTFGRGIRRIPRPEQPAAPGDLGAFESMDERAGLSGDRVLSAFQDRDGCIWFGTVNGLDRFRPARAVPASFADGTGPAVLVALADGSVMAGPLRRPPNRLSANGTATPILGDLKPQDLNFGAAANAPDGSAWVGAYPDILQLKDGTLRRITAPPDIPRMYPVQAMGRDADGQFWASWWGSGLRRLSDAGWDAPDAASNKEQVTVAQAGAENGFWRGLLTGEVIRREGSKEERFGPSQGLDVGMVLSILARPGLVAVGGESGVAVLIEGRFRALALEGDHTLRTVSGLVESADGDLWLNEASGILRVHRADLERWKANPSLVMPVDRLDWHDGVLGSAPQVRALPAAARDSGGRLWFGRNNGVYWIDPARPAMALAKTATVISGATVDGHALDWQAGPRELPPDPQYVVIAYTAPIPSAPERMRYRYRLVGLESDWQPATVRREAVYTHLAPGSYSFEVQAMDGNAWQSTTSMLAFKVRPAFHQTFPFRAALILVALAIGWCLYRWRLAAAGQRIRERLEARLLERERIARELHDTLLQSTLGLTVQVEAARQRLAENDPLRERLALVLDQADASMIDARERVRDLRRHQQEQQELSQAFGDAAVALRGASSTPEINARWVGTPRPLTPTAWDELNRAGMEAIRNAFKHSACTRIDVCIDYASSGLALEISDNGVGVQVPGGSNRFDRIGFQPEPPAATRNAKEEPAAHFGLLGLRERIEQLGGELNIHSSTEGGTRISVRLRAAIAYPKLSRGWLASSWSPSADSRENGS